MNQAPSLFLESDLWARGYRWVAGMDEAGRGSWAGPVVAAFVVLPPQAQDLTDRLRRVRDSKLLSPQVREACYEMIADYALSYGVGVVPAGEIDRTGIVAATRMAMRLAVETAKATPDYLLIDSLLLPDLQVGQYAMPKGDRYCLSIAAASIIAKVTRDRGMVSEDRKYPGYGFAQHKGYGTRQHHAALRAMGPTPLHRQTFRPIRELVSAARVESSPALGG